MTAKANTTTAAAAASTAAAVVENIEDASYDRLMFGSSYNRSQMLIDKAMQNRNLSTQNQVPKEINAQEEIHSKKRNLGNI
jgi:hypothetical protein